MIKINKHIASFLLGIFIFPLAFQSIHIVRHHDNQPCACHHACSKNDYQAAVISTLKKITHCPICEYKFPINNLPTVTVFEVIIAIINGVLNETIMGHPNQQVFETKSPRAPPLLL